MITYRETPIPKEQQNNYRAPQPLIIGNGLISWTPEMISVVVYTVIQQDVTTEAFSRHLE